ncbi:unnamed protein product [Clonostachys rosea]|uniref:Heterokaryon incompatibility domain-containing protein n=1 Tax=Bionectria ochroleuca TaxID=29856 RepID=A0ABY6UYX3_BIOOC|nr:unnamed protein product [Clonostachys rosea]
MSEEMMVRTTKANLGDRMGQIPIGSLPKVFQDAIVITAELGIQWLWIDALCIVQDDLEDYQKERQAIGDIYQSSYLTLAASGARNSREGLFLDRNTEGHIPLKYTFEDESSGDISEGRVYVRALVSGFRKLWSNTLHSRAWTLQEHLLSRRIVYFDTHQMLWVCQEDHRSEDQLPEFTDSYDGRVELLNSTSRSTKDALFQWQQLVMEYSRRDLSRGSDKLPALSAIAVIMEKKLRSRYIAGLWEEHLVTWLLWRPQRGWMATPTSGYRAPSWSWASLDGEVTFMGSANDHILWEAKVDQVSVKASTDDPRGELSSGLLKITGFLHDLGNEEAGFSIEESQRFTDPAILNRVGYDHPVGEIWYDQDPSREHHMGKLHCLLIRVDLIAIHERWYGLVLRSTSANENVFYRVGYARPKQLFWGFLGKESVFDGSVEQTITII